MTRRSWLGAGGGILALVLTAVLFTGAVFAEERDDEGNSGQAFIERLAGKLGITTEALQDAVQETQSDMLDEAVADGRLSEEQAEAMRERIESGEGRLGFGLYGGPGMGRGPGMRGGHVLIGPGPLSMSAIADELGLTTAELREQLTDGATLAEVIEANGATVDEIVAVLVEQAKAKMAEAVADGRITQEQADALLAELPQRLTEQIEAGFFCPAPFERHNNSEAEETSATI